MIKAAYSSACSFNLESLFADALNIIICQNTNIINFILNYLKKKLRLGRNQFRQNIKKIIYLFIIIIKKMKEKNEFSAFLAMEQATCA